MSYAIKAVFDTVQGEGARAGCRSVFVRFAGCNLWDGRPDHRDRGRGACAAWCDTDFVGGERLEADQLLERMRAAWDGPGERWCVLTGGEPMLQVDEQLLNALYRAGWHVAVETNGTCDVAGVEWVTCSPKLGLVPAIIESATEVKVILPGSPLGWTTADLADLERRIRAQHYWVQPQDPIEVNRVEATHIKGNHFGAAAEYRRNVARCMEVVRALPSWRISAQGHKLLGVA